MKVRKFWLVVGALTVLLIGYSVIANTCYGQRPAAIVAQEELQAARRGKIKGSKVLNQKVRRREGKSKIHYDFATLTDKQNTVDLLAWKFECELIKERSGPKEKLPPKPVPKVRVAQIKNRPTYGTIFPCRAGRGFSLSGNPSSIPGLGGWG